MRKSFSASVGLLFLATLCAPAVLAAEPAKPPLGKGLAFDSSKGNCLACHAMPTIADAEQPGDIGPPLIAMNARFPDIKALRAKIWDATASNPDTFMPPFGKHKVLTEEEIDQIVDFVYGL